MAVQSVSFSSHAKVLAGESGGNNVNWREVVAFAGVYVGEEGE